MTYASGLPVPDGRDEHTFNTSASPEASISGERQLVLRGAAAMLHTILLSNTGGPACFIRETSEARTGLLHRVRLPV